MRPFYGSRVDVDVAVESHHFVECFLNHVGGQLELVDFALILIFLLFVDIHFSSSGNGFLFGFRRVVFSRAEAGSVFETFLLALG